ncbi:MAG: polysaccharide deacetylase family protein [Anaerolineae bacterium]
MPEQESTSSFRHHILLLCSTAALALLVFLGSRLPLVAPQDANAEPAATTTVAPFTATADLSPVTTPSPTLTLMPSPSPTPSPTETPTLTPSPTPTASPTATPFPTLTPTPDMTALDTYLHADAALQAALCMSDTQLSLREGEIVAPMLLYHFVGRESLERDGASTTRFDVTAANFDAQLALLHRLGYQTVTVAEIAAALHGEGTLPERPIAITFDDGWVEQYSIAFPLLQKYGMKATFYVPSSYTTGGRVMTWEQLAELRDAGMEIGAHTRKHVNLLAVSAEDARYEIFGSKSILEAKLDITVESMAYPYGLYSGSTVALAQKAGYRAAVALNASPKQSLSNLYALRRFEIHGAHTLTDLIAYLPWRGQGTAFCPEAPPDERIK